MKRSIFAIAALIFSLLPAVAQANESPKVESFTASPTDIELTSKSTKVEFELIVSHPAGIETNKVEVTITSSRNDSLIAVLNRTDSPVNSKLTKVTFKGSIDVPRNLNTGVYTYSASPVKNNSSAGYEYTTGTIEGSKLRDLVGAQYGLLIRSFGDLNLDYVPFNGPAYDTSLGIAYENSIKYSAGNSPKYNVGEIYDPSDYFELRVPSLSLAISTSTPKVCTSDGKIMRFISEGSCAFAVSTPKTNEYRAKSVSLNATIAAARVKIQLVVEKVANQTAKDLPKSIELFPVYSASTGYVLPKSETPTICLASGYFVKLISGGTCTLSYQSPETPTYRASDVYLQTFEIVRTSQTIEFAPNASVQLDTKILNLSATSSSGAPVSFTAEPSANCSISGNSLALLNPGVCNVTAQQVGTPTVAPVSKTVAISITGKAAPAKRTISCVKGSKTVKVTKVKPKCPKGYSKVR